MLMSILLYWKSYCCKYNIYYSFMIEACMWTGLQQMLLIWSFWYVYIADFLADIICHLDYWFIWWYICLCVASQNVTALVVDMVMSVRLQLYMSDQTVATTNVICIFELSYLHLCPNYIHMKKRIFSVMDHYGMYAT